MTTEQALIEQQYADEFDGAEIDWWYLCGLHGSIDKAMQAVKVALAAGHQIEFPAYDPDTLT